MNVGGGDSGLDEPRRQGSLTRTVVRGVALAGGGYALTQILTLGSYVVLARLVTPTEFGQFAAGMLVVGIGFLFTESGMSAALVHRRDRIEEAAATAVISTLAAGLGFALLALAISPLVGLFFDSDTVGTVAAAMSGLLLLQTLRVVPGAILQRRFSFLRRLIVEPIAVAAFGATAVVLAANGLGVWGLVLGQYAAALTHLVLSWALVRWRPQLRLASFAMWRELIAYGRHVFTATVSIGLTEQVPTVLIGRGVGTGALGQFRYGFRIAATPVAMIMAAASYVLFPAFARIAVEPQRFQTAFLRGLRWSAVVALPAGLILIPLAKPLAILVFGRIWADAGEAAMALAVFCSGRAVSSVIVEGLKASGRPDVVTRMNLVELVAGTAAMVALLPFGLIGVSAGVSIGVVVRAAYAFLRSHQILGLPLTSMTREIWPPAVAAVAMVAVLLPLEALLVDAASHGTALGLALLAAEATVGVVLYGGLIHLLAPGALKELVDLVRTARRRTAPAADDEAVEAGLPTPQESP